MNFSIYLPNDLAQKMDDTIQSLHMTRNNAIREAVEQWLDQHAHQNWPANFFDFKATKETPDFSQHRSELLQPNEDIL